MFLQNLSES